MRSIKAIGVGVFALILSAENPAKAASLWFLDWPNPDGDWHDSQNWLPEGEAPIGPPNYSISAYVTSFGSLTLRTADIDAEANTAALYVGGWGAEFDDFTNETPSGDEGVINVYSDLLTDDNSYIRVGYRGAKGTVNHYAGTIGAQNGPGKGLSMDLGFASPESEGYYNLSGTGQYIRRHLDVGTNGLGVFTMTGGHVGPDGCGCGSMVGFGFESNSPNFERGRIPGIGLWDQSDGDAIVGSLVVGDSAGSVGIVRLHGDDPIIDTAFYTIGRAGSGNLVMNSGLVDAWSIVLGEVAGSFGMVSIRGGTLHQSRSWQSGTQFGIYVGQAGSAQLTIIGSDAVITANGRFEQGSQSVVEFQLVKPEVIGPPEITTIAVNDLATFNDGALLRITLSKVLEANLSQIGECQPATLMSYGSAVGLELLNVEVPNSDWKVDKGASAVTVTYDPVGGASC